MEMHNVSFSYGKKEVLKDVSISIKEGKITTLLGGNGCGKSTLFNLMTKNLTPKTGKITLEGMEVSTYRLKEFSRKVAIVHQYNTISHEVTVAQLVSYGRLPYTSVFLKQTDEDERAIAKALALTNMTEYQDEFVVNLSGGQKQRAWIAMALAQETEYLFLDEPTTYLDVRYQVEILKLVQSLNEKLGLTVVMVLHDINQAIAYSDEILGLKNGKVITNGKPSDILNEDLIEELYGITLPICRMGNREIVLTI